MKVVAAVMSVVALASFWVHVCVHAMKYNRLGGEEWVILFTISLSLIVALVGLIEHPRLLVLRRRLTLIIINNVPLAALGGLLLYSVDTGRAHFFGTLFLAAGSLNLISYCMLRSEFLRAAEAGAQLSAPESITKGEGG